MSSNQFGINISLSETEVVNPKSVILCFSQFYLSNIGYRELK